MASDCIKVKAIAVRAVPYGESDMIVTLVGVDTGKLTATAKGCLKRGAKLRYAAEPFNFGEYVLAGRNGRYVISECSQIDAFSPITADLDKYYDGCLVLEAIGKLSEEPSPEIFMCALKALSALAYDGIDPSEAVRDFLLGVIEAGGSNLNFETCNLCGCVIEGEAYFQDADGIVCKHCKGAHAIELGAEERAFLAGREGTRTIALRANIRLLELVYIMLGVKINSRYLTEQL